MSLKCNGADEYCGECRCAKEHNEPVRVYGETYCTHEDYCPDKGVLVKCVET